MGRPLMTTTVCCIFCLLCAAHTQCLTHHSRVEVPPVPTDGKGPPFLYYSSQSPEQHHHLHHHQTPHSEERAHRLVSERKRRHVSDAPSTISLWDEHVFVEKMFERFGNGKVMTLEGFQRLLEVVGLEKLVAEAARQVVDNVSPPSSPNSASTKSNASSIVPKPHRGAEENNGGHTNSTEKCLTGAELFTAFSGPMTGAENTLSPESLHRMCPGLLYQLSLKDKSGCIHVFNEVLADEEEKTEISHGAVWLYATLSIIIVSLCGLLGVAVIPVMQKVYYQQLLQFLVALAVGTLCGDALLHLLPHAMMGESDSHAHSHHSHDSSWIEEHDLNMWKGLVASLGLVFFFFMEKCLTLVAEWRKQRQRKRKVPSRVRVMGVPDNVANSTVGEKLCKHKYSSYPYCYGEITTDISEDHHHRNPQYEAKHGQTHTHSHNPIALATQSRITTVVEEREQDGPEELKPITLDHNSVNAQENEHSVDVPPTEVESYTVIIREHENKHHGHSHTHGHVHSPPETLSSVVWMVVMGDGLHNFTDGMAIGAAFAANIAGGFSTAVAVFCHELPHELGDFAVLLKAGMSAKQAVFYNLLSSILCLLGMVLGVFLGESKAATAWVFSLAAGMFLYIALVDMIPELTTSHSKEGGSLCQCLLQCVGILTGIGIMFLIAAYEHDLKTVFTDKKGDAH